MIDEQMHKVSYWACMHQVRICASTGWALSRRLMAIVLVVNTSHTFPAHRITQVDKCLNAKC